MHLIQIFLPLYDNDGNPFPEDDFDTVRRELVEHFGGITTYVRSPARGVWKEDESRTVRDDLITYEVMAEERDTGWWRGYREDLCHRFCQESLVIRAMHIQML